MGKSPDSDAKLCTYILDIVSGNGRVATIDRPFGYNNDIQPFLPCSVLQGGVVERKHDRKTQTVAVTWAFRSMVANSCGTEEGGFEFVTKASGRQSEALRGEGTLSVSLLGSRVSMLLASPFFSRRYSHP